MEPRLGSLRLTLQRGDTMKLIQITKTTKPAPQPAPQDVRTPSGRKLPW